ncbi:terminase [Mycobacterium phage Lakes]|uniref:Gene 13 protein n=6 Tax=root TaxID=1 RepID=VG13_BPMD2|nr:terminase large subunit [Mycobacterium phage D29]O64206.1 RecName: Full=Gene 13 protein; AltName: Full=Gp13 [Fromanvirus D29]AOQ27847.1 terminase [Mycobacterium phage Pomar16]APC43066.1 terminase [Mycobacterium phage Kerberos]APC46133.1 terminase [Mycobacterium phage StarStuff]AXH48877.1 terminase [Mycobacterium phage Tomathan]QBP28673.1 terminase [Mycobacterium phage DBQu4n]QFG08779.1 terminase [Mycobacterium phage Naji]QJD52399.1 terminase [Mycobacterium phage D32]QUE25968.1 terminase
MSLDNHHPELAPSPPHIIGPSWQKTVDGDWHLPDPKMTLGWGVLKWLSEYVNTPGGHDDPNRLKVLISLSEAGLLENENMFIPTDEQVRLVLWWYAVDEKGQYVYREGVIRRLKGWGKDPFTAALCLAELCGPVAFSHFDETGQAIGKPRPAAWITVAAVSQDQTKNTFSLFPVMISKKLKTEYGLDVNRFIIYSAAGGRIEAATSSPASMEGNRPTFVVQNETQWWGQGPDGKANEGHAMAEVIEGNMTKVEGSRTLSICNAHIPGTETVAEKAYVEWQDVQSGKSVDTGMMYDALEAPADTPISEIPSEKENPDGFREGIEKLREGLLIARGDSTWLPIDDIIKSILSTKNSITESRRKFLNQVNAAEDSWLSPQEWNRCFADPDKYLDKMGFELAPLDRGQKITLGFDGSKSNDWTALVGCRVSDGLLFVIDIWDPQKYGGEVPREFVDAAVHSAFSRYDVVAFRADVKEFEAYVDSWGRTYKKKLKVNASPNNPVAFDMRGQQKRFAFDCERLEDAVLEGEVWHDGNPVLRQHVLNAKRHPTTYDAIAIRKVTKDSSKKIDAAVCAVLAFGARQDYLMSKKARTGRVVAVR